MESNSEYENPLQLEARNIVKNVLISCKAESLLNKLHGPVTDFKARTAHYTGMSKSYVCMLDESLKVSVDDQAYDVFQRMLVLKSLLKFYTSTNTPFPSVDDIYQIVKESINVRNVAHFHFNLTQMGFDYRKTTTGQILAEDMKLTYERYNYLKKKRKFETDKAVFYYIDERVVNSALNFPKPNLNNVSETETATHLLDGYYFYHVLSDKGLENYLFTNKKCKQTYIKWVFDIVLKVLKPNSVIIIDGHPLHGELCDEIITRYHSKADMINWLKRNNVPFNINMHKADLFELISQCKKPKVEYRFDKLLKAHGFDVLRLPFGCNNMSPSSLLWKELGQKVSLSIPQYSPLEVEEHLIPAISSGHWSSWRKLQERITYWEDQFIEIDARIEEVLDSKCKFDVSNIVH